MGVQIVKTFESLGGKIRERDLEPAMRKISKFLVSSAVGKINGDIPPANAPLTQAVKQGSRTLRDNGQLMASIAPQNGRNWAAAGTNLKYARINQDGGTIHGKAKGLWLPAGARTRTLSRQHNAQSAGELIKAMRNAGYSFYRIRNVFFAKKKKGEPFPLFVIKKSVEIPSRPFLYISANDEKYIMSEIQKAVHNALEAK